MPPTGNRHALAMIVGVVIASFPVLADAAQAPRVTIHELKTNWKRYDGRTVQLRGQIDQCDFECFLCPEDIVGPKYDSNRYILMAFEHQHEAQGLAPDRVAGRLMAHLYRFATVTMTAKFSSLCFVGEDGNFVGDVFCTDGPANLDEAVVLEVHSRKSPELGLNHEDEGTLSPALPSEQDAMLAEFKSVVWFGIPKMFSVELPELQAENKRRGDPYVVDGVGCICLKFDCEGRWPTRLMDGMNAVGNPFYCWKMQKKDSGWRVLPNF